MCSDTNKTVAKNKIRIHLMAFTTLNFSLILRAGCDKHSHTARHMVLFLIAPIKKEEYKRKKRFKIYLKSARAQIH